MADRGAGLRRWAGTAARVGVSAILLGILVRVVDLGAVVEIVGRVHGGLLGLALALLVADRVLHGWRWIVLLRTDMEDVPTALVLRIHLISSFLANFLPFNLGSDGPRVVGMARYSGRVAYPLSSVIVDRVLGAAVLGGGAAAALVALLAMDAELVGWGPALVLAGILGAGAVAAVVAWEGSAVRRLASLLGRWLPRRWADALPRVHALCLEYAAHPRAVAKVVGILVASLAASIVATWITGRALGMEVAFLHFVLFVPVVSFLTVLPVSANGLGVLEGGMVLLFTQVGATEAEALTLALAMRLLMVAASLPGGALLAVERWPRRADPGREGVGGAAPSREGVP